ncbi:MAG: 4Fe-4S binding protein [Candidatus Nezhaarchaeales archaeon]
MGKISTTKIIKIDETKCDGCGACISACPEGALQIINGKARLVKESMCDGLGACIKECPRGAITIHERGIESVEPNVEQPLRHEEARSEDFGIVNWPIKLELINPRLLNSSGRELVVAADCTAFVYKDFASMSRGKIVVSGCPIFGDKSLYRDKLMGLIKRNDVISIKAVRMEVPCCSDITRIAREALERSGKKLNIEELIVTIDGKIRRA